MVASARPPLVAYLLVAPALLLIAALVWALLSLLLSSAIDEKTGAFTLAQYERLLTTPHFLAHFWRSAWLAGLATMLTVALAYPVAYAMEAVSAATRRFILVVLVLVFFSDYVLRMFGLILVFGRQGLVNRALVELGLLDSPARMMFNEIGVLIGLVSGGLPFMIFAINGVLARIDRSQLHAASLLGASPTRAFLRITLPLSASGVVSGSVIVFLLNLNSFVTPALLGGGFVEMVATFIYEQAINLFNLPLGAAIAFILFLVAMALLAAVNWWFDRFGRRFGVR